MGEDAEEDGAGDHREDRPDPFGGELLDREQAEDDRGEAAGPNQAMKPTVRASSPLPARHSATGSMRITVRLSTA